MTDADEVHGPIDYLLLEFPSDANTDEAAAALMDLVARDIVRIYDLLVIRKAEDGSYAGIEATDLTNEGLGGFVSFAGARSGLLGDEDISAAAEAMEPGTAAALIIFENAWARPFVAAARGVNAQVVASARIPAEDLIQVLDSLEAAEAAG